MGLFFKASDPAKDVPDLAGKVVIVTGGNNASRRGAKVYLAARNENKAKAAIDKLHAEGLAPGNGQVAWLNLDLSDPLGVATAAKEFMQKETRLDILVNNAALLLLPFQKSHHGIQDIVMVNYIGTYIFTRALLPLLKQTAQEPGSDVRIVAVNSNASNQCPKDVRFRNLGDLNRDFADTALPQFIRYAFSKLMQLMFIKELQRRLEKDGVSILCIAVDPGAVNTEGVQAYAHSAGRILSPIYSFIANAAFATPTKGASGVVFAAASPVPRARVDVYKGAVLQSPGKLTSASKLSDNVELREELWETTERVLREIGVDLGTV